MLIQTLSGKVSKEVLTGLAFPKEDDLNRRIRSWTDAATMKYSCFNLSSFPSNIC